MLYFILSMMLLVSSFLWLIKSPILSRLFITKISYYPQSFVLSFLLFWCTCIFFFQIIKKKDCSLNNYIRKVCFSFVFICNILNQFSLQILILYVLELRWVLYKYIVQGKFYLSVSCWFVYNKEIITGYYKTYPNITLYYLLNYI